MGCRALPRRTVLQGRTQNRSVVQDHEPPFGRYHTTGHDTDWSVQEALPIHPECFGRKSTACKIMNGEHDEVLDSGLIADIPKFRELFEEKAQFHWQFYSELALLRSKIYNKLKSSLLERAAPFSGLVGWQRAVKYKYSLSPLSTKGSLADSGGRINIGAIDPPR